MTFWRTFTPREDSALSLPIDLKSRDSDAAPRLKNSNVIEVKNPPPLRSRHQGPIIKGMHALLVIDFFGLLAALAVAFAVSRRIGAWRKPR